MFVSINKMPVLLLVLLVSLLVCIPIDSAFADGADSAEGSGESGGTGVVEPSESYDPTQPRQSGNAITSILKLILYTVLILILIYAFVKFLSLRQRKLGFNKVFQSIGGMTLGPNKSIQLVKVGDKLFLLGVGDHISLIKEIDDPDDIESIEETVIQQEQQLKKNVEHMWQGTIKPNLSKSLASFQQKFIRPTESQNDELSATNDSDKSTDETVAINKESVNSFESLFQERLMEQKQRRKQLEIDLLSKDEQPKEGRSD